MGRRPGAAKSRLGVRSRLFCNMREREEFKLLCIYLSTERVLRGT